MTRISLARTPNWTVTDPDDVQSEWWTWKNPGKPFDNVATIDGRQWHLAFDKDDINESKPQDYYEGAIVRTTMGWVMGGPYPARVVAVDRKDGSLAFPGRWGGGPSLQDRPRLPLLPGGQAPVPRQPRRVLVRPQGRRAAGSTSACPATRTRTPPGSRWRSAST